MKIHILGICGTFMGSLALLLRDLGYQVSGSDMNVYPPMSTLLEASGIPLSHDYEPHDLDAYDLIVIGNTLGRGNPSVEYVLDKDINYCSGAECLADMVLRGKHVLAVSGTHGKTTTTSMLVWLLEQAGLKPGFLIGGVAENFGVSARLGQSELFVIEADEYDTAFFDKRSKFIHYHPKTLIINNIEFDHADIFVDIAAIRREFHHLVRTLPGNGHIIARQGDNEIDTVLTQGCWTPVQRFGADGADWYARALRDDYSSFHVFRSDEEIGVVEWDLIGRHNADNALAAIAAAENVGVSPHQSISALASFKSVLRRLQQLGQINGITVYDDFAHHPTAIKATLSALRQRVGEERIIAILEPRSNTMKMGVHKHTLADALQEADQSFFYRPENLQWDLAESLKSLGDKVHIHDSTDEIIKSVVEIQTPGDHILVMSNGGFDNIHQRLMKNLQS